ncbi:hypothetical protein KAW96_06600 [candidate division WOR-3 bacterium]|nr:hypothetical protein [candidate division WOR-3 bacterium]
MDRNEEKEVLNSFKSVEKWVNASGYKGYDPYDIKGAKVLLCLQKNKITRTVFNMTTFVGPYFLRRLLNIRKTRNAKAMALFARAYLIFYRYSNDQEYLSKAKRCLNWLAKNYSKGFTGYCWGYSFNWQSRILIPKETPSGVVTSIVIDAFLDAYRVYIEKEFLDIAESSCQFILKDLNWDDKNGCFSYTPLDNFHIHNANLFAASSLFKVYALTKKRYFLKKAEKALEYSLNAQNSNGSWYYWGNPDRIRGEIDHFHTGFILRALYNIYVITKSRKVHRALLKGARYYRNQLFSKDGFPLRMAKSKYPIDIHTCAEAILSSSLLKNDFTELKNIDKNIVLWTIDNMQDKTGFFYYRRYHFFTLKIGFIRWGAAWMMLALSQYLLKNFGSKNAI